MGGGGGVFWVRSDLNSAKKISFQFSGGGVFWVRSDLDCGKNFNFGGWGGAGVFWNQIPEQGCPGEFGQKFLEALACLCITDSLSHTTFVETKKANAHKS